jgi:hypothetical protein
MGDPVPHDHPSGDDVVPLDVSAQFDSRQRPHTCMAAPLVPQANDTPVPRQSAEALGDAADASGMVL